MAGGGGPAEGFPAVEARRVNRQVWVASKEGGRRWGTTYFCDNYKDRTTKATMIKEMIRIKSGKTGNEAVKLICAK